MEKELNTNVNQISGMSLSGKQSVRSTFKLNDITIDAIDWIQKKYNLKPKEIFDTMCSNDLIVKQAINWAKENKMRDTSNYKRKTFVISKNVLRIFNKESKNKKNSRDMIIEYLVLMFQQILKKSIKEEREKEEEAKLIINELWGEAESIEVKLKELLDKDNPIIQRFGYIIVLLMNLSSAIDSKLSDDIPIDPDDF